MSDPTPNNERRWVCAYPDSEPCQPEDWTPNDAIGCGYANDVPEFIRCDWCGKHGHCGGVVCEVCAEKAATPPDIVPVPRADFDRLLLALDRCERATVGIHTAVGPLHDLLFAVRLAAEGVSDE